ncbi:MAG: RNA polymerase subunit sigma-70 [Prevotellaceae bacterium]|jgi:hypothetical protein|nr:RNA polymerase subunit sigma-70 [Prevotellaceae bacterium]
MNNATISADIIASTSLSNNEQVDLSVKINRLLKLLNERHNVDNKQLFFGRLIKGDYIECFLENPQMALRTALLLKMLVKSFSLEPLPDGGGMNKRRMLFRTYGIRISIAIGKMSQVDIAKGILNGEAIYRSGRRIEEQHTSHKQKVIIKNTLFFDSDNEFTTDLFESIIGLFDTILNKATPGQSEVVYLKLLGNSEKEIADTLKVSQPSVNRQSKAVGWNAIERALIFYEKYNFE